MSQERMVNLAFVAAALVLWFLSAHIFGNVFEWISPNLDRYIIGREFRLSNLLGISIGVIGGLALWRNVKIFGLAHEVAGELRKVTWPTAAETRLSTIVVVITTVVVAATLWVFDMCFSFLTTKVYGL